jgi:nucleoside-diphosphate-sugar epimerase
MKVFVAGGTGVVGQRLRPRLVAAGHEVVSTTRYPKKTETVRQAGAQPVVVDGLDERAMLEAVTRAEPQVVIHEMTGLAGANDLRHWDRWFATTNELRTRGTDILIRAAQLGGAQRLIAQSFTGWPNIREGGPVKTENDPLDPSPPAAMHESLDAIRYLERVVGAAHGLEGIVLRYGAVYGPATMHDYTVMLRKRKLPIIGDGAGIWSFLHLDDAAAATVAALDRGAPDTYNVVDDDPAAESEWVPYLAELVGAKPPRRIPVWLARIAAGEVAVSMMTQIRGSSNAKAKRELGWEPRYRSWRDGFSEALKQVPPLGTPVEAPAAAEEAAQ